MKQKSPNSPSPNPFYYFIGLPVRSVEVAGLLDTFLVFGVVTILVVRVFLWLTGYPQIGGGGLHIAHMLWGGLLMLAALILMQSIITRWARRLGAVVGGIGFGLFIDEVGKFVTSDNNYFFRPTFAIIYVLFILIYLITRNLLKAKYFSPQEALANAIEFLKEASFHDLEEADRVKAMELIRNANVKNPMTSGIQEMLEQLEYVPNRGHFFWERIGRAIKEVYLRLVGTRFFPKMLAAIFLFVALYGLFDLKNQMLLLINVHHLNFVDWAILLSGALTTFFIVIGDIYLLRQNYLLAYHWFDRALLVAILIGQIFIFVQAQLKGMIHLSILLILLIMVRYMISQEETRVCKKMRKAIM